MPAKLDKCVEKLLKRKSFQAGKKPEKRKSSAFAICQNAIGKNSDDIMEMLFDLPDNVDISIDNDGGYVLEDLEDTIALSDDDQDEATKADPVYDIWVDEKDHNKVHVFSEISLADVKKAKGDDKEEGLIPIEMLRGGLFHHPWYGPIEFTRKKFLQAVQNFANGVVGHDIAFDTNHIVGGGAAAWLKQLGVKSRVFKDGKRRPVLTGKAKPTPWGNELIEGERFRYFSSEIDHEYLDKEDPEKKYGAAIIGGGLTNRPYITGLEAIAMSEDSSVPPTASAEGTQPGVQASASDGTDGATTQPTEETQNQPTETPNIQTNDTSQLAEGQAGPPESVLPDAAFASTEMPGQQAPVVDPNSTNQHAEQGVDNMKFDERIGQLETSLAAIEDKNSDMAKMLSEQIDYLKTAESQVQESIDSKLEAQSTKLTDEWSAKFKTHDEQLASITAQKRELEINQFCDDLVNKDNHFPAIAKEIKTILSADAAGTVFKFSEGEGAEAKEVTLSLMDAMRRVADAIPMESRVDKSESLNQSPPNTPEGADVDNPGVVKFADGTEYDLDANIKKSAKKRGFKVTEEVQ